MKKKMMKKMHEPKMKAREHEAEGMMMHEMKSKMKKKKRMMMKMCDKCK